LSAVNRIQRRNGFQFDQNRLLHQKIGCVSPHNDVIKVDRDAMLLLDRQAGLAQFLGQRILIDLLKKTDAQRIRNDKRAPDDFLG